MFCRILPLCSWASPFPSRWVPHVFLWGNCCCLDTSSKLYQASQGACLFSSYSTFTLGNAPFPKAPCRSLLRFRARPLLPRLLSCRKHRRGVVVSQGLLNATQGLNPPRVRVTGNLELVQSNHNLFAPKFHNIVDKAVQPDDIIHEASTTRRHIRHALRFELIDKRHQPHTYTVLACGRDSRPRLSCLSRSPLARHGMIDGHSQTLTGQLL
ncbi:hypothetical protein B0T18DRAFT_183353 [Schizothecium vesticola]|uniref:Uncharacterized protein n=1 Tax=Schizothecium vesticola TaxID=314040 RepID=A0AA40EQ03_9PEZI|nr:hypothetical protein B0T18DRAFT_183353 [Schizothecium vesticola]